jgi:hypothetical protein
MFLGTAISAYMYNQKALWFGPLCVWITSLLYWSHPTMGWRRDLDRITGATAILWHAIYALTHPRGLVHMITMGTGILMYFIGWTIYDMGDHYASVFYHMSLHLLACASNFPLFTLEG